MKLAGEKDLLLNIEGLRFIASAAIVLAHFIPYAYDRQDILYGNLRIFVDLFFVISGIVIHSAYSGRICSITDYCLFMQRRLARLYPLHLATMLFYMLLGLLFARGFVNVVNPDRYDFSYVASYLTLTQAWFPGGVLAFNSVTWSISAEIFCYLCFPVTAVAIKPSPVFGFVIVLVVAILSASASHLFFQRPFTDLLVDCSQLRAMPSFCFGVWLAAHRETLRRRVPPLLAKWSFECAALTMVAFIAFLSGYAALVLAWLVVAAGYAADLGRQDTFISHPLVSDRGKLTYSIYMIHPLIATAVLAFAGPKLIGPSQTSSWIAIGIGIIVLYVAAEVSFRRYEEPLRRFLSRPIFPVRNQHTGAAH